MTHSANPEFVPLSQVHYDRLNIYLPLPQWINPNDIGINLRGIERIRRLSGLKSIVIVGSTGKETSQDCPSVVGWNQQGEAYAARETAGVIVPLQENEFKYDAYQSLLPQYARWADARVEINIDELTQRIQRDGNSSVRDINIWVKGLNETMRNGLFEVGDKHLMQPMDTDKKVLLGVLASGFSGMFYSQVLDPISIIPILALTLPAAAVTTHLVDYVRYLKEKYISEIESEGYRWSIYPHKPIDREATLSMLCLATTFVKNISGGN